MTGALKHYIRRIVCICAAWAGLYLPMQAQTCQLSVENGAVAQGTEGGITLLLTNETNVSGGQFTVTLPEGVTIKNVTLNGDRSSGHTLEYRLNEAANSAKVLFYARPTASLKGNSGALCTLAIAADAAMDCGEYQVTLADVRLAADATTTVDATTVGGTLTVTARYRITVAAGEGGSVAGEGIYDAGETVTVSATPNNGYHFVKWSDGSTDNPYSFEAKEDIHLIAEFAPNIYTITYVVDGEEYKTCELEYGASITAEAAPTKEGHTFSGWSEIPETMPAEDVTVTGSFTANVYKVTYVLDGEVFKVEEVVYGTAIPTPDVPAKEGYNFSGWGEVPETMPAHDLTLTGSYTINKDMKYNLIYMVDGVEYKRVTLSFGDAIVLEAEPTKEGHTFSGWSEVPETMPLHDVTVTGSFTANSYTLTYVLDGETFKSETVVYGTTIVAPEAPAKEGYTFGGWENLPEAMPAKDVTVTGSYTINKYTLTYTVDGETYKTYELEYGTSITSEEEPTKEGYTFSGWSEIPETMPASDVTVSGIFIVNKYLVTFTIDGEVIAADSLEYGAAIVAPEAPEREGHTFNGWGEVAETVPAHDVTYEGSYTVNTYKVYYYVGEELVHTEEVAYGEAIPEYTYEPEEGYTFLGWSGETYETMPAHDVTYTANIESGINDLTIGNGQLIIYDLTGRKVTDTGNLKSGIYIVNGRKVVIE